MEVLTKKKITGYVKQPRITVHKMVNLDLALRFIADEGIKLIGIGIKKRKKKQREYVKCSQFLQGATIFLKGIWAL